MQLCNLLYCKNRFLKMTTKLYAAGTKNKKLLMSGLSLGFVATLLVTSFYFVDNHEWYWDIAPVIGALIVILAASGGLLIGHSLAGTQERRMWLVGLGGVLGFAWIASGTVATALGFLGMNYLPDGYISWASYSSAYLAGWVDISLLQFATATGLLGSFCIGFGFAQKLNHMFEPSIASLQSE
jgi:hypothetical protein